jgi:hypothetical protein
MMVRESSDLMVGVSVVSDDDLGPPAQNAVEELIESLQYRGFMAERVGILSRAAGNCIFVIGVYPRSPLLKDLSTVGPFHFAESSESFAIRKVGWHGREVVVIAGSGDRGMMYGVLDVAKRIRLGLSENPLSDVEEATENPALKVRSACIFLHNADLEKQWYYSGDFWKFYFDTLASARFNNFSLTFGHQTSYMSPPYPFLIDLEEFPQIRARGLSHDEQRRNLETLRMVSKLSVEHGIDFTLGLWQQHAYRYGDNMVEGLDEKTVMDYCPPALKKLLIECPGISALQFRVNHECGVVLEDQPKFWKMMFKAIRDCGRPVKVDLRAKSILDSVIQLALDAGLDTTVSTKYWCEHMGLPYHETKVQLCDQHGRRYSYADLLRYPRSYSFIYQLWNVGSHKLLLWGDPDYARRFARSCHLGEGVGFEVHAPLSNRGYKNRPGVWSLYAKKDIEYYRWEQERYWAFYLLFGRMGYNPEASESIWMDELSERFGAEAAPYMDKAYRAASKVISLIMAYHAPSASNFGYWPEKDPGGLIDLYIEVEPSDVGRFYSIKEYVSDYLNGVLSAKLTPGQLSDKFRTIARESLEAITVAEKLVEADDKEFRATKLDVEVLSALADYHSEKILAGEGLGFFYETCDYSYLKKAIHHAEKALSAWEALVHLTDGVYYHNLHFGPEPSQAGHWKDDTVFVRHDVERLKEVERLFLRYGIFDSGYDFGETPPKPTGLWTWPYQSDYSVERRFKGVHPDTLYSRDRGFGWRNIIGLRAVGAPGVAVRGTGAGSSNLPADMLYIDYVVPVKGKAYSSETFLADLPDGLYDLTFIMCDKSEEPSEHGPMKIVVQGGEITESFTVGASQLVEKKVRTEVFEGRLSVTFDHDGDGDWIINGLIVTRLAPHIGHVPLRRMKPGSALALEATVTGPRPIESVLLFLRAEGGGGYTSLTMSQDEPHIFRATVPEQMLMEKVEYYIEARDVNGEVCLFPSGGSQSPILSIIDDYRTPPKIVHDPVRVCSPGEPLTVKAIVESDRGLKSVKLYYRNVNQSESYRTLAMGLQHGIYEATIPGRHITTEWDVMYYIEAIDESGNGAFHPDMEVSDPYVVVKVKR